MKSYFFNALATTDLEHYPSGWDREYDADDHAAFFAPFFGEAGVMAGKKADACKVQVQSGTTLAVSAGVVYIRGRMVELDGTETITVDKDCKIVVRLDKSMAVRDFQLLAVTTLTRTDDVYDMELAGVHLEAVSGGHQVVLTDTRTYLSYMGQPPYYPPSADDLPYILWLYAMGFPMTDEQRAAVEGNPSLMAIYNASIGAHPSTGYLPRAGGKMTGLLELSGNPTKPLHALPLSAALSDDTKSLFGLPAEAMPDDLFKQLANIPTGMGRVAISFKDSVGSVPNVICTGLHLDTDSDVTFSNNNGVYICDLNPGVYNYNVIWPIGYANDTTQYSITVIADQVATAEITGTRSNAKREITIGCYIKPAAHIESYDITGIGGGGSGAAIQNNEYGLCATGGAGGKTSQRFSITNKNTIKVQIGAGAAPRKNQDGQKGGTTSVTNASDSTVVITAEGGNGGTSAHASTQGDPQKIELAGASGGSGSAGASYLYRSWDPSFFGVNCTKSGSDGANGGASTVTFSQLSISATGPGGSGQGRTQKDFADSAETVRGSAGAGAAYYYRYGQAQNATGTPGDSYAGTAIAKRYTSSGSAVTSIGGNGTDGYGSGGGAAILSSDSTFTPGDTYAIGGKGGNGIVAVRSR